VPAYVYFTLVVASIIIQICLAHLWDFPWVIVPLTRWLRLLEKRFGEQNRPKEEPEEN